MATRRAASKTAPAGQRTSARSPASSARGGSRATEDAPLRATAVSSQGAGRGRPAEARGAKAAPAAGAARALSAPPAEPRTKLPDLAYQQLEEAIVTLRLPPGAAISEQQLSDMTGIGRTPIREAIQRLARERLIIVLPQRGLLVAEIDVAKQLRLLEMRREVERMIARAAARRATADERERFASLAEQFLDASSRNDDTAFIRADREFNELCLVAARNEFAEAAMRHLHGLSRRFWYMHYKQAADMPEMARLHAAVARAIARGEPAVAAEALDALVDNLESFTRATVLSDR